MRPPLAPAAVLLLVLASGCSGTGDAAAPGETASSRAPDGSSEIVLPGDRVFPEGIARDSRDGTIYVGSTDDGAVYRVEPSATEAEVFLPPDADGRTAVTGLVVDEERDRLLVAGRDTGRLFVYDLDGELVDALDLPRDGDDTLVNDLDMADGAAYVTDSFQPLISRVVTDGAGEVSIEPWLDLTDTVVPFEDGFNLNGIVATPDGQTLLTVHYGTGQLFRIDIASREVVEVDLGAGRLPSGDGLELTESGLVAVAGGDVVPVSLSGDYTSGEVGQPLQTPPLRAPTTLVVDGEELVVVNSQLDMVGGSESPQLPFTVSRFRW